MGGRDWENTKAKVKKEVEVIAYDLLRLYARRKMQQEFNFYLIQHGRLKWKKLLNLWKLLTNLKQSRRLNTIWNPEQPMDRLICGDVGFGKTEVAMRAIFKAITSGKQVAVVVPTTIFALQHYQTIAERFKPFGVNVELLSRFRTRKEQTETVKILQQENVTLLSELTDFYKKVLYLRI